MKTFTDSAGRSWTIALNIDAAKRVRDLLGVNLLEPEKGDPPLLMRIGTDEILLCDCIYCLCKPQADQQNVTDEQFGAALGGEAILAAQTAFYEELIDFFRQRGRSDRARAVQTQMEMINLAIQKVQTNIEQFDIAGEMDRAFTESSEVPRSISGRPSTSSPGPSASSPDR